MNRPKKWKLIRSEIGPEIPLFRVRYDYMQNPRTEQTFQRLVLEAPDWVNVTPIRPDGKILVVRQFRFGIQQITTEIPAGIIDPGEDSFAAAQRELREETGHTTDDWTYLGAVETNPAYHNNLCHHWLAKNVQPTHPIDLGEGEDIELDFLTRDEIKAEIRAGTLRHSLAHSALARVFPLWQ